MRASEAKRLCGRLLVAIALVVTGSGTGTASGDAPGDGRRSTCDPACWQEALQAYASAPAAGRRDLLALARDGTGGLPPLVLLALADANLRSGRTRAADQLFAEVATGDAGDTWRSWANAGRAWVAIQRADVSTARAVLVESEGESADPLLSFVVGLLEAGQGNRDEGRGMLGGLLARPDVPRPIRLASEMGLGLASYWSGRSADALATFEGLASRPDAGIIADEAAFAAARVQLEMGNVPAARRGLERLVAEDHRSRRRAVPKGLLDLEPRAVQRESVRIYRAAPLRVPIELALDLLDWDGRALARRLLDALDADDAHVAEESMVDGGVIDAVAAPATQVASRAGQGAVRPAPMAAAIAPSSSSPASSSAPRSRLGWLIGLVVLVLTVVLLWRSRSDVVTRQRN